jgi:hypothetical protein
VSAVLDNLIPIVLIAGFLAVFAGASYLIFFRDRGVLDRRLDFLRRGLTKGFEVGVGEQQLRRGEEVEALVTVSHSRGLGDLEVGLICTESYDYRSTWTGDDGASQESRETAQAVAYEEWQPVESVSGAQSLRLRVPVEAPFSYKGECLSFKWEVAARGRRRHRLDTRAAQEISVLP